MIHAIVTQYHLIRTTVNFLLVMVLVFSQNFTSNGPFVVLNFCEFSDTTVLTFRNFNIFWQFFFSDHKQKQYLQDFVRYAACDASYLG